MPSGSYEFDQFIDSTGELGRLKSQAELAANLESNILKGLGVADKKQILEIGAGPGFITELLAENSRDSTILALDYSFTLISKLRQKIKSDDLARILPTCADATRLPVSDRWANFSYLRFLLQHVPQPIEVLREVFRCTDEGGVCCVVDSDDSLVTHYPENPEISAILESAQNEQAMIGGDRHVGRKLQTLLVAAGFSDVKVRIVSFTPSDMPLDMLMGMGLGYKAELLGVKSRLSSIIEQVSTAAERGEFFFSTGVFLCTGVKR